MGDQTMIFVSSFDRIDHFCLQPHFFLVNIEEILSAIYYLAAVL